MIFLCDCRTNAVTTMSRPAQPSKMAQIPDHLHCGLVLGDFGSVHIWNGISLSSCAERIPTL